MKTKQQPCSPRIHKHLMGISLFMSLIVGCTNGGTSEEETTETTTTAPSSVQGSAPKDSTGVEAAIGVDFTSGTSASALQLVGTLDVGGGVILSDARVSIASIKLKAEKAEDDEEKALKEELEKMEEDLKASSQEDEDGFETSLQEIESRYEALIEVAADETAKDQLEVDREAEKDAVEEQMAVVKKEREDQIDALKAERDSSMKWKGPYVYDLIGNTVTPALPESSIMDGSYKRIEFELKPNRTLEATDPLLNHSVYLEGTVDIAGVATPFKFAFDMSEQFKMFSAQGAPVVAGAANNLVVAFQPALWFANVDFSSGIKDAAGVIIIDKNSNPELLKAIKHNIKSSTKFGKDDDGDGELKEEESDGDGAEAVEEEESAESSESSEAA